MTRSRSARVPFEKSFKKSSWGGRREGAGCHKKYLPIMLDFEVETAEDVVRLLKMVPGWILQDRINTYRARALVYTLKTFLETVAPLEKLRVVEARGSGDQNMISLVDLGLALQDQTPEVQEAVGEVLRRFREEKASESPVDYVKIIDLILDQFPLGERDRILEKAKEQYLKKNPLVSHT